MNVKLSIILFTIFISTLLCFYIFSSELEFEYQWGNSENLNQVNNIKIVNRGEKRITIKPGYEKIGRLQAKKVDIWIRQKPLSPMRTAQYRINHLNDEGELVIFSGIGGTPKDNIKRWYGQFKIRSDSSIANKIEKWDIMSNGFKIKFVYMEGIYIKSDMKMSKNQEIMENYALLAAILVDENEPYYFKMTGPIQLINYQKKMFESFINSIEKI